MTKSFPRYQCYRHRSLPVKYEQAPDVSPEFCYQTLDLILSITRERKFRTKEELEAAMREPMT